MFLKIIEVDPFLSGNATLEALLSGIATSRVYGVNWNYSRMHKRDSEVVLFNTVNARSDIVT